MMFRTLCAECEQKVIDAAKQLENGSGRIIAGCCHYQVGVTCYVEDGEVLDWSCWPAIDSNAFFSRAAAIGVALDELRAGAACSDISTTNKNVH